MALPWDKLLANVGAGGRILDSMNAGNAFRKGQAEADYARYTEYANALSKLAYSQIAPASAIGQILNSPGAANMDPQLYNRLAQQANSSLGNNYTGSIPAPSQTGSGRNVFERVTGLSIPWGKGNALTAPPSNGYQTNTATQTNTGGNQGNATGNDTDPILGPDGKIPIVPPPGFKPQPGTPGYNTQFKNQSAGTGVPGSMGVNNPTDVNAANRNAQNTTATGQAANQNELQKNRSAIVSAQSQVATQALKTLEGFSRSYDKSSYKGQFLGDKAERIPSPPGGNISPEQLANRYANQYLTDLTGLGDTPAGRTDEGRSLIAGGKPDLSLDKDAKKELYESNKAKLNRIINSRDFVNDFYKNNPGATDEQLVGMMNAYNRYAPSYDYENGKPLPKNDDKFRDFTSQHALNSYIDNGDYNPYKKRKGAQIGDNGQVERLHDLTGFKNDKEFNDWYWSQIPATRSYVDKQLKAGIY